MATVTVCFLAYSCSTPFTNKFPLSAIQASTSQNYPLASKVIVKRSIFQALLPLIGALYFYQIGLITKLGDILDGPSARPERENLAFSTSEGGLLKEFSKYGQIAEVKLIKDEAKQKSKGFAFIQYTSQEAALLALESMDHQLFEDRQVFVELAKPRRNDFGGYPKTSGPPQRTMIGD